MKIKNIIAKSNLCTDDAAAVKLLEILEKAITGLASIGRLSQYNSEAYMEDSIPFVRFELNKVISDHYIICISPEVRFGKVAMVVCLNHMLDGLGMQSQSWEPVEGSDDVMLEGQAEESLSSLAQRAKTVGIEMHAKLIERVGVVYADALKVAKKNW
jgi:hypothetical protein